jgi:N-methylhydantoinase B
VVIDANGGVDQAATHHLRQTLRDQRGETIPMFNYGPVIEDLRAMCMRETGLSPPIQPVWTNPRAMAAE